MSTPLQTIQELDGFYAQPDPWNYQSHPDDLRRKNELLALLPRRGYARTLDVGCGAGFLTLDLPGEQVLGVDVSAPALEWAQRARAERPDAQRFAFEQGSVLELDAGRLGSFELVVVTGVLYAQYIGKAFSVARTRIDALLAPGGVLVSCHIAEWEPPRFPYTCLDTVIYPYRGHTHRLEVYAK